MPNPIRPNLNRPEEVTTMTSTTTTLIGPALPAEGDIVRLISGRTAELLTRMSRQPITAVERAAGITGLSMKRMTAMMRVTDLDGSTATYRIPLSRVAEILPAECDIDPCDVEEAAQELIERIECGWAPAEQNPLVVLSAIETISRYIAVEPESKSQLSDAGEPGTGRHRYGLHSILESLVEQLVVLRLTSKS